MYITEFDMGVSIDIAAVRCFPLRCVGEASNVNVANAPQGNVSVPLFHDTVGFPNATVRQLHDRMLTIYVVHTA